VLGREVTEKEKKNRPVNDKWKKVTKMQLSGGGLNGSKKNHNEKKRTQ